MGEKLTELGHEVIGVDEQMEKVEAFKEKLTHTICLDSTNQQAVTNLPLRDTDLVIVCIGEKEGANIMATALMKQLNVKRLISRALGPLHKTVLQAMGVTEIVHPEEETADRWAKKLNIEGIIDSFEVTKDYNIVEVEVPKAFIGKSLQEIALNRQYNIIVLTTIQMVQRRSLLGTTKEEKEVQGVASSKTVLQEGDIMVLYGNIRDIHKLLKDQEKQH